MSVENNPIFWRLKDKFLRFEGQACPCCDTKIFGEKGACPNCHQDLGKVFIGIGEICSISADHNFSKNGGGRKIEIGVKFSEGLKVDINYHGVENNFTVGMKVNVFAKRPNVNDFKPEYLITSTTSASSEVK
ncbi:hypothetical protein HYS03_01630 [Candidatus Woesebacteria bacterium]|nr:hypothetical protein [Candidatus Woesebacteria bacterium]QQG47019.1 MAG: hypothetical protein HY044_02670 [Candidatus Woesebacteria bacterium]